MGSTESLGRKYDNLIPAMLFGKSKWLWLAIWYCHLKVQGLHWHEQYPVDIICPFGNILAVFKYHENRRRYILYVGAIHLYLGISLDRGKSGFYMVNIQIANYVHEYLDISSWKLLNKIRKIMWNLEYNSSATLSKWIGNRNLNVQFWKWKTNIEDISSIDLTIYL